jgi:hypothetical protein
MSELVEPDDILEGHPPLNGANIHEPDLLLLNDQQKSIFDTCINYLQEKSSVTQDIILKPLHLIVHGGPGTGKSFLISCLQEKMLSMGVSMACVALTGIAASNLPRGRTIHSFFNFPVNMKGNLFLDDLSVSALNRLKNKIDVKTLGVFVIDEISYISPELLGQIDKRLQQIMGVEMDFGGLVVLLMGDFYQLPPVGNSYTLYAAAVKLFFQSQCLETNGGNPGPRTSGTILFSKFKLVKLDQQMRCSGDVLHSAVLQRMRNPHAGESRVDPDYLESIKTITPFDFRNDIEWYKAPIVVTSNMERHAINEACSKLWGKRRKTPSCE